MPRLHDFLTPKLLAWLALLASLAQPVRRDVRVCAGGDVSLGTNLDTAWVRSGAVPGSPALPDPAGLLAPLAPLFAGARIVLLNVEGAIGEGFAPRKCAPRSTLCYALRQPPAAAAAIRHVSDSATVVGNVANNHAHDAGPDGFDLTLRHLEAAGVAVTGADTLATPVPVGEGDTIAVLGFSPWTVANVNDLDGVGRHVARAAARFGRVLVTMHIGAEGPEARHTHDRPERFAGEERGNSVAFARVAIQAGASMVTGHGPHVLRAVEWAGAGGRGLVAHSLGNLVTYGPFTHTGYNGHGAVVCATIAGDGSVHEAVVHSTAQRSPGIVSLDSTRAAARDIAELSRRDFPRTGTTVTSGGELLPRRPR